MSDPVRLQLEHPDRYSLTRGATRVEGTGGGPSAGERLLVLWWGRTPPALLIAACLQHGMAVRGVLNAELNQFAPHARVLVVEVPMNDSEFFRWGSDLISEALAHGLRVALVQYEDDVEVPRMEDEQAALRFFAAVKAVRRDPTRAPAFYRDWGRVAQWARDHLPGPGASARLVIHGAVPEEPAAQLLLRRAFHDLCGVSLEVLTGGKSGASVWRVHPSEADRAQRTLPFVVKIHEREKMLAEQSNCLIVRNAIESRLHAALHTERCVEGDALGLVVYDVVARAMPFRIALPAAPDALIASLFGQTLGGFRVCAVKDTREIAPEFGRSRLKALRWSDALREAAEVARAVAPTVLDVGALEASFLAIPIMPISVATVHGDLHTGNLFVPAGSTDVQMIDYGSVLQNAPVAADPACLEVSLCFPSSEESLMSVVRPSKEWLRAAFRYPLDPADIANLQGTEAWLPQAVRAIRAQAVSVEPSRVVYSIAVASYLVRFASFDSHAPTEDRALAYELACELVAGVTREVGVKSPGTGAAVGEAARGR